MDSDLTHSTADLRSDSGSGPSPDATAQLTPDVTAWLAQLGGAEPAAAEQVYTLLYDDLHRIARSHMRREADGHTLSATALVHEAWFRLSENRRTHWNSRTHFLSVASTIMRRLLVDHALARRAAKRDAPLVPLNTTLAEMHGAGLDEDVVAVHEALLAFEAVDARAAKVVELRFFGGLEVDETAAVLGVSPATIKRDWVLARAWLRRELGGQAAQLAAAAGDD